MCWQNNRDNKPIRLLIVDDSPHILKTLTSFFRQHPRFVLVGTATDGRHALRHVTSLQPDLVLMDVRLPGMSGLEATRRIKARHNSWGAVITMAETDILAAVNRHLVERRKHQLPPAVVRRVAMILLGADLVALHKGRLEITAAGRHLNALLDARTVGASPPPAFVSR